MKKRIFVIGGIIIIAGAVGVGAWYYLKDRDGTAAGDEVAYVTKISSLNGDDSGVMNRFAGVVEPQETVKVSIESGRKVKEVQVKTGEEVKAGQLLFEYDLTSIQEDLQEARLSLDRLKNEALSLNDQIKTLEKEKKKATSSNQLSYTIEIETNKMNLKKNEYDQISKEAEITKLENATGNTEVRSEIDGVIQKIDTSKLTTDDGDSLDEGVDTSYYTGDSDSSDSNAFITILSTGAYRIKGTVNEQNMSSIIPGEPVIIRSRVDETQVWHGTMGEIDEQNASSGSSSNMYYGMIDTSGDSQTNSSSYPFYVELESSEGLMLGQHVYIEKDEGQEEQKEGIWLSDFYIVDADSESPYVWAANDKNKLEKREVVLGQYDETLGEYEIADGLTEDDSIAFPAENLVEGMATADGSMMTELGLGSADMGTDSYDDIDMIEDYGTAGEASMEDYSDEDYMVPMDEMDGEYMEEYIDDSMDGEYIEDDFYDSLDEADLYDSDDMEAAG